MLHGLATDRPVVKLLSRRQRWLVPAWSGLLLAAMALALRYPVAVRFLPIHLSPLKWVATGAFVVLAAITARHYWIAYRYSRFPLQFANLISTGWLVAAQVIVVSSELGRASWLITSCCSAP